MTSPCMRNLLRVWHRALNLPRQSPPSWYRERLREELQERQSARSPISKLSETADVFFASSRAHYDGCQLRGIPRNAGVGHLPVYLYMLAKYSSRWHFYRTVARLCRAPQLDKVREVINPAKDRKLAEVAVRHHIDPIKFTHIGRRLRRVWPLLP